MPEPLLQGNRRFVALWLAVGLATAAVGLSLVAMAVPMLLRGLGSILLLAGTMITMLWWNFLSRPRLAISDDELWVYMLATGDPIRVPLDAVEVFFMGQGAVKGKQPGQPATYRGAVAANVVVRIAESATDWHCKDVNDWLGVWEAGYITVRGLWCEDIHQELLKKMNKKLLEKKRRLRKFSENYDQAVD